MASLRLLQCPNLLAEVFSHLEVPAGLSDAEGTRAIEIDCKRKQCRRTLAAAARSCRAFTDHAQTVLWRRLDSMQPLLSLLSHPHPEFSDAPATATKYSFVKQIRIVPESWRRFQTHARRVKVLHDKGWSTIHPSTWAFVARWCGPEPLLPNLEELSGLPISVRSPATMMFISPKLRSLSLALTIDDNGHGYEKLLKGDPMTAYILLQQIVSTAPGIRSLSIYNHLSISSSCFFPIQNLQNIDTLYARECELDFFLLRSLGTRPLRSLVVTVDMKNIPEPSSDEDEDYGPFYGCFRTLKHLTVRGTPEHIDLFLDNTTTCELKTIAVEFLSGASQNLITRCIADIAEDALLYDPVLRELTITYPRESHYDDERDGRAANTLRSASLADVITPALGLLFLRKVTLDFHRIPALIDTDLRLMIDAWPRLTALHIMSPRERYGSRVKLTPSILVDFARQCPRLVELTLPEVPLHDVPAEKDMPLVGQRALRRLWVCFRDRGPESVLYKAALFIDRLFPCLALDPAFAEEVEEPRGHGLFQMSWEKDAREEEKTWRRIEEFLYVMQLGRRHREELGGVNMSH
ncbi:hypothetical protein V8D89_001109 [Ganoderma adspersum]